MAKTNTGAVESIEQESDEDGKMAAHVLLSLSKHEKQVETARAVTKTQSSFTTPAAVATNHRTLQRNCSSIDERVK